MRTIQAVVAQTVDRLDMHATAPALLLGVQGRLGELAGEALRITENGRRPFRPTPGWEAALADVAFAVLSLADQTGVDLEQAVQAAVARMSGSPAGPGGYPPPVGPVGPGGPGGPDGYGGPAGVGGRGGYAPGGGPDHGREPGREHGREPGRGFGHRGPGPGPDPRGPGPGAGRPTPPPDDWPLSY